jgi:hypothetical protein
VPRRPGTDLEQLGCGGGEGPAYGAFGDNTQADVGFASAACDVDEYRHGAWLQDRQCTEIEHDRPWCCGELVIEQVLEIGYRQLVETPADVDHRHASPEMTESNREGSRCVGRSTDVRAHGDRIPRCCWVKTLAASNEVWLAGFDLSDDAGIRAICAGSSTSRTARAPVVAPMLGTCSGSRHTTSWVPKRC